MEYSLYNLNQIANLKSLSLTNLINTLNLIGFEVDEIFNEKLNTNKYINNTRILIKIPSNREDLLNQQLFLKELSTIFLFEVQNSWYYLKTDYSSVLKQKYFQYLSYKANIIDSNVPYTLFYQFELKNYKNTPSPLWLQTKLLNTGISVSKSLIFDIISLILFEWGQTISSFLKNENTIESKFYLEQIKHKEIFIDSFNKKYELPSGTIVLKNESHKIISVLGIINAIEQSNLIIENKLSSIVLQAYFYDIHENKLSLNTINTKLSLRYLRKLF